MVPPFFLAFVLAAAASFTVFELTDSRNSLTMRLACTGRPHLPNFYMSDHRLENYLKTHRKRARLSQEEVACLLGSRDGTCPARHEAFGRTPSLETALAYEAIYGVPVRELFAGTYERAERETARRARAFRRRAAVAERCSPGMRDMLNRFAPERNQEKLAA
jgi:transcriptional regulator with XRE-family HTH domain